MESKCGMNGCASEGVFDNALREHIICNHFHKTFAFSALQLERARRGEADTSGRWSSCATLWRGAIWAEPRWRDPSIKGRCGMTVCANFACERECREFWRNGVISNGDENIDTDEAMKVNTFDTTISSKHSTATSNQIRRAALKWHEQPEQTCCLRNINERSRLQPVPAPACRRVTKRNNVCKSR